METSNGSGAAISISRNLYLLNRIEKRVCSAGFAAMTFLVLFDVFGREVLSKSFPWAQKSAVYLMIWLGFLGASLTSATGGHLRPEIADRLWKGALKTWIGALSQLMTAVFCAGLAAYAWGYVQESKALGDVSVVVGLPMWIVQLAIPYTFASMAVRHFCYAVFPAIRPQPSIMDQK